MPARDGDARQSEQGRWNWSAEHPATAIATAGHRRTDGTSLHVRIVYKMVSQSGSRGTSEPAGALEIFLFFLQGIDPFPAGYVTVCVDDLNKSRLLTFSAECGYDGDYSYMVTSPESVPRLVEVFRSGQHLRFTACPQGSRERDAPPIEFLFVGSRQFAHIRRRMQEHLQGCAK